MKKTYNITVYYKALDSDNDMPSTVAVITASDEKVMLDFIKEKKKEIMKENDWKTILVNDGVEPIIDYEEAEVISL